MFNRELLLIYIVTVCCFSCTRSNYSTRSTTSSYIDIVQPVALNDKQDQIDIEIEIKQPKRVSLPEINRSDISNNRRLNEISHFSDNEKKHVSTSTSFDPFEKSNPLVIDLDELQKSFTYPCKGGMISNYGMRSGRMHSGVDLKVEMNDKIYAVLPGVVRLSLKYGAYGNVVVVRHSIGIETVYSHNNKNLVKAGDIVKSGEVIALGGKSGNASTTHIHFEVRVKGKIIDPNLLINTNTKSLQSGKLYLSYKNNQVTASNNKQPKVSNNREQDIENSTQKSTTKTKTHVIKKGDSLYSIARKYRITVDKICKDNNIKPNSTIHPGQKLKIK